METPGGRAGHGDSGMREGGTDVFLTFWRRRALERSKEHATCRRPHSLINNGDACWVCKEQDV